MENHDNVKYDSAEFLNSISNYLHTIEEVYNALEEKQKLNNDPSYSLSLQILGQLQQQMKSLMERRLSSNALAELLSSGDLNFSESSHQYSFAAFTIPKIYENVKEEEPLNLITEKEIVHQTKKRKKKKKKKPVIKAKNTYSPPPWKPKK